MTAVPPARSGGPAPDWLYDIAIQLAHGVESATLFARSPEVAALTQAIGFSLGDIMRLEPLSAGLVIEHALSPFLDAWERRLGARLEVVNIRRASPASVERIERDVMIDEASLRLALEADGGAFARAFARLGGQARGAARDAKLPDGQWRLVIGPLDLPRDTPRELARGDALGFEPSLLKAALMADDGTLWARLAYVRGAFRIEMKGRSLPEPGSWIEVEGNAPSPEGLIVGDEVEIASVECRLYADGVPDAILGQLIEIDGRLGFQAGRAERAA